MKLIYLTVLVVLASCIEAKTIPLEHQNRDVADFLLNVIGLQGVWDEIQNLGGTFVAQILNEATQLIFAGQDVLSQAQAIFAQLVADLTSHTGNAASIVQLAINQVAEILKSKNYINILRIKFN